MAQKVKIVSITVSAHVKLVMLELRAINVNITFFVHHLTKIAQVFDMLIIILVFCCFWSFNFSNLEGGAPTLMTDVTGILEQRLIGAKCIYNIYDIYIYILHFRCRHIFSNITASNWIYGVQFQLWISSVIEKIVNFLFFYASSLGITIHG